MELHNIQRTGPLAGACLSTEEIGGLEPAVAERKINENLLGKIYFWGKIYGSTQDYLVVYHIDPTIEFPDKTYYFCTTGNYELKSMPPLTPEYTAKAETLKMQFTGDAAVSTFNGEEAEPEDPEAPPVEKFREVHRLAYTVKKIDRDCAIVPRGALVVDAAKKVISNSYFTGLSFQTASESRAYMHFRRPESYKGIALLKKPGIIKSGDFLDCIDKDAPTGIWSVDIDNTGTTSIVRNMFWSGYSFYAVINSSEYGGVYFGNGVANHDIAFM